MTVFESQKLANVEDTIRILDFLSWFMFVVVGMYALAVYLAADRRREAIGDVGVALIVGSIVLVAVRSIAVNAGVNWIVTNPTNRPVGRVVAEVFTQLLWDMAVAGVVIGFVISVYAALLGPHRWATAVRRRIGMSRYPGAVVGLAAIVLLALLVWWSPGLVFQRW